MGDFILSCIWEKYNVQLYKFIKKRVSNEQDAEDILQEVFIKIQKNIGCLKNDSKMKGWIYKIARNTIIDYYRKSNKNYVNIELHENIENSAEDKLTANAEIALCLKEMIDCLPKIYKQAIILTKYQNITQKELGKKVGISVSGAKSRVQRGRKRLKEMLLNCCYLEIDQNFCATQAPSKSLIWVEKVACFYF